MQNQTKPVPSQIFKNILKYNYKKMCVWKCIY